MDVKGSRVQDPVGAALVSVLLLLRHWGFIHVDMVEAIAQVH